MPNGRSKRVSRPWLIGLAASMAASGLLLAQAVEQDVNPPVAQDPAQVTTTQPATKPPATTPPATSTAPAESQPVEPAVRARLLSGLVGSKHDFTQGGKSGRNQCLPCHTPHLAAAPPPRLDRRQATTQPLRRYQGLDVELTGWSLLCLGCHDGVTAPDVYSSSHAITITSHLLGAQLGQRGLRSHPVGIAYPAAAEKFNPRAAVEAAGLLLPDGRIQCTTCHDAHNTRRHARMLVISDERSRLCLTCHRL